MQKDAYDLTQKSLDHYILQSQLHIIQPHTNF